MPKKINIKGPIVDNDTAWIYEYFGWDCTYPAAVARGLEEANGEDVVLEINSPGGLVVAGYDIYTSIMQYEGNVTAHVIVACSAATLLVCAADKALISDTGIFMIHNAQGRASGDYRDLQMETNTLKEIDEGIINAYVRKTGMSREDIQELMDQDTYMSPQTALQHGFIDGYMFGDPNAKKMSEENAAGFLTSIVAADMPIIPENKAKELMQALRSIESLHEGDAQKQSEEITMNQLKKLCEDKVAPVQPEENKVEEQNFGAGAVSGNKTKGETNMTLEEFLAENPEAQNEVNNMRAAAQEEGMQAERERLQSLDAIAGTVTKEALNAAKYGENPVDGPTLAYQAMTNGEKLASSYMAKAIEDNAGSGAKDVGVGSPDAGQEPTNEADDMASYVNKANGGK